MLKDNRVVKNYSENFKLKVLSELESGRYTKNEICRIYNLSPGSLYHWIKKYSTFNVLNKRVRVETMDEKDKIKELEKEISRLKEALVKKDLDLLLSESFLEVMAEQHGYKNVEELKKKLNIKP